jgi:predicted chitinase
MASTFSNNPKQPTPDDVLDSLSKVTTLAEDRVGGIFSSPSKKDDTGEDGVLSFFGGMFRSAAERAADVKQEVQAIMEEEARRSAESAALYRMERNITQTPVQDAEEDTTDAETTDTSAAIDAAVTKALEESTPTTVETETVVPTGGLMSPRLDTKGETPVNDSIIGVALSKNKTNEALSKTDIETQIKDIVGTNTRAAGILGAFTKESGADFDDLEESNYYSLMSAYGSWRDSDVDAVLATLPADVRARLKADYDAGIRTGGSASGADRQLLGNAMFDTKYAGGSDYRGRGLIHITHDYNYKEVGDRIGVDLLSNPELVNDPRYAVPAALAFLDMNGYFDEDTSITKNTLHNMVNRWSSNAVKNDRWKAAQKYLKEWGDETLEESSRPKLRPEEEE